MTAAEAHVRPDLRVLALAAAGWLSGVAGFLLPARLLAVLAAVGALLVLLAHARGRSVHLAAACLVVGAASATVAVTRVAAYQHSPVASLAEQHAFVRVTGTVTTDPVTRSGKYGDFVTVRLSVLQVDGRGRTAHTRVPVLVVADLPWARVALGSRILAEGRLAPADSRDLAAVLSSSRAPRAVAPPAEPLRAAGAVRRALRESVAPLGRAERSLIPALVVGDDQAMPEQVVEDFRVAGLTHLAAVSGTNLTLVVGFLLLLARWVGVRARGLLVVGALGVVGFVLLARTEPSVVRAAAMGTVALLGMGSNGREKGVRALGTAVLVLLLLDPWLALSPGFALSALATAGILLLAPPWRDALAGWMPRWLAEAVAVPFAAQLACTPMVAAISGQVSLVAVVANMLVAAAVGPATVLGLVGGLTTLVWPALGQLVGRLAGWCAWWIVTVAEHTARLPTAAVGWSAGAASVAALTVLCLGVALGAAPVLRRRWWSVSGAVVLLVLMARPLPTPGWPPAGWVMVVCDVGQGDGLVLDAGEGRAVVVDAGPDPPLMARCLRRLGVRQVPLVLLTHFHADHVGGLAGVLDGRGVGEVDESPVRVPAGGASTTDSWAAGHGVPVRVPAYGETRSIGDLTWQVVGPSSAMVAADHGEEGTVANNASVVLLVQVRGVRILLAGDMEPEAQQLLDEAVPGLHVDVLKVPHHGSRYQDPEFLTGLGARVALVSVGAGNDYGHPAPETMALLQDAGMVVRRTDLDGDIAVVVRDGRLSVRTRG